MKKVALIAGGVLFLVVIGAIIAIATAGGGNRPETGTEESGEFVEIQTELSDGWWREPEPTDD